MFNWLFKKLRHLTPEQQLAKDVEDVVQAMKESLGEAGRWEARVKGVEETYKAVYLALLANDVVVKVEKDKIEKENAEFQSRLMEIFK